MYKLYDIKIELFRDLNCVLYIADNVEDLKEDELMGNISFNSVYDDFCFDLKTDDGATMGFIAVVTTDMTVGDIAFIGQQVTEMMMRLIRVGYVTETKDVYNYVTRYVVDRIYENLCNFKNGEKTKHTKGSGKGKGGSSSDHVVGFGGTRTQIGFQKEETE